MEYGLKFRPIKPRSPHFNGKVERSEKTDLEEFYPPVELQGVALVYELLSEWQHYSNWERPQDSLGGKTPIENVPELASKPLLQRTHPTTKLSGRFSDQKCETMSMHHTSRSCLSASNSESLSWV